MNISRRLVPLMVLFSISLLCATAQSGTAVGSAPIVAQPTQTPTPPPAAPGSAPAVPTVTPPNQPNNGTGNVAAAPPPDERYKLAIRHFDRTPPPNRAGSQSTLTSKPGTFILNWSDTSVTPDTIYASGSQLQLTNLNDILYSYDIKVTEIKDSQDDLAQLQGLTAEVLKIIPSKTAGLTPTNPACTLQQALKDAQDSAATAKTKLDQLTLKASASGKYPTVSLSDTVIKWDDFRSQFNDLETKTIALQTALAVSDCRTPPYSKDIPNAEQLILDNFLPMQSNVTRIQKKRDSTHTLSIPYQLKRTSDYDIVVTEKYNDAVTDHPPVTFHLNRGYDVLTLSGGFLLTKLQARSYSVVAQPIAPPAGSPAGTPPTSQNVLGADGLGSGMRGALVALLNYHDPFEWCGNKPNFGLSLSAGPVFDISQGKADTSKFGIFVGGSVHLWNRFFITPGVHFGEFADFPQGFHNAGDPVPANFGTPTPTKRWTGHFAIGITFRGKDLSNVVPGTNNAGDSTKPAAQSKK